MGSLLAVSKFGFDGFRFFRMISEFRGLYSSKKTQIIQKPSPHHLNGLLKEASNHYPMTLPNTGCKEPEIYF